MADLYPGEIYVVSSGTEPGGDGWTHIGWTEGGVKLEFAPQVRAVNLEAFRRWPPRPVTLTITVDNSEASATLRRLIRQMIRLIRAGKRLAHRRAHPGSYSRCRICHPEQAPGPLAVNGHRYHRRQLNRVKRRRHA